MIVAEQSLVSKHRRKRTGSYEKKKTPTHGHEARAADASKRPHEDESHNGRGDAAAKTADGKSHGGDEEADATAKDVRDAAVQRLKGGRGDEVGRGEPGRLVGGAKLGADDGVRGCRDGTVEAIEEDVGHDGNLHPHESRGRRPRRLVGRLQNGLLLLAGLT